MNAQELQATARAMVAPGKGILAADESAGTVAQRLASVGIASTEETRRAYRDLLLTTPGIEQFISGVILVDETIRQKALNGTAFPALLAAKGIIAGIKVDKGAVDLAGLPGEKVTEGLDGLRGRLAEYRTMGARFAKWRAVITIGDGIPSRACLESNAHALARYAALCQEAGLVPIVEPEVLLDGAHDIARCAAATWEAQRLTFAALVEHRVMLEGVVLKPNMVLSGKSCPQQAGATEVAEATVRVLRQAVPAAVPGIAFLSGGQGPVEATVRLNAINRVGPQPWELTFSFARALQEPPLQAWKGNAAQVPVAQKLFYHRARCNAVARAGKYSPQMEETA